MDWQGLHVNPALLQGFIETLAGYGADPAGGTTRPAYSPAWAAAQRQVIRWMEEVGLEVRTDAMGDIFGRLAGTDGSSICIAAGSHLDTVKQGGKLDGAYGVVGAVLAVRLLQETFGRPRHNLEVVVFCEEEGSRFPQNFLGSRALVGKISLEELETNRDAEGISVAEALKTVGLSAAEVGSARRTDIASFIELHIEQGPILEAAEIPLGIVHTITGLGQLEVTFTGQANHAGTTPMDLRRDPMAAAATMITRIRDVARQMGRPAVATVGRIEARPGGRNIVPASVTLTIDYRHAVTGQLASLRAAIEAACREAAHREQVTVNLLELNTHTPAPLSPAIVTVLESAAKARQVPALPMVSGAGHDSQFMALAYPTAMLFVPSKAGISHSPAEYTPIEHLAIGIEVLATALGMQAYQ